MENRRILVDKIGLDEDPLIFLHKVSGLFIMQSSVFWKRCLLFHFAYLQIFLCASYPKIAHGDLNYLPYSILVQTSILVCLRIISRIPDLIEYSTFVKDEAYCLKCAGEEAYERIANECKLIKTLCYSSMFMMTCLFILSLPFLGDECHWHYPFYLIKEHIKYLQLFFFVPLYTSLFFSGMSMAILMNVCMYNISHILFQWHILNQFVIKMSRGMSYNPNDIRYQERVQKQLARCVRMQSNIMRLTKVINKHADKTILGLIIAASIMFVSASFFILTGVSPKSNLRMSFVLVPWFEQLCTFCLYCQRITNESHHVFNNALQCPWYNWNIRNRKTYLLFLIGNTNVMKLSMYRWVYVESSLIVRVCRLSYSILTLLLRIKKRR